MLTTVHRDVDDGNVLVYLCVGSSFALVRCVCNLAYDAVDNEI